MALAKYIPCRLNNFHQIISNNTRTYCVGVKSLGKKLKTKNIQTESVVVVPTETDPQKLAQYVCGTNLTTDEEPVKIKPDSEYPDWLWSIHTGKPLKLKDMDPNTLEYWLEVKRISVKTEKYLRSLYPRYRNYK
ncbi:UNVERIFIED_CONTAM: hypothetical protein PYX00_000230 [Menopon gallinae]|uniref:Large ribosomal subunit protein mL54 n=1 Tax=Menopon gallinae TaxID=328185 RepID=A0AAW2I8D7_9NEOP